MYVCCCVIDVATNFEDRAEAKSGRASTGNGNEIKAATDKAATDMAATDMV
ncbi:hypothetical protein GCM10009099_34680 [Caenispirillum bisanense]